MARRSRKKGKNNLPFIVGLVVVLLVVIVAAASALKPSHEEHPTAETRFSIADYRRDASRLTGNRYRLEARVENIETLGNDRLVAVSISGNKQERLPLLVKKGATGRTNLTRGDTFIFEVDCRTGRSADGAEVKGILVVNSVETK